MGKKSLLLTIGVLGLVVLTVTFFEAGDGHDSEKSGASEQIVSVDVNRVIDGDTIEVEMGDGKYERVRLIGIDAPEIDWEFLSDEEDVVDDSDCFAWESRQYLIDKINGKQVELGFDESQGRRDDHERLLAYVFDAGENINLVMTRDGYARELTVGRAYQYQSEFVSAQSNARDMSKGLWRACNL